MIPDSFRLGFNEHAGQSINKCTVKLAIYAGGKVCIFCSQTICMGIKYPFASFTTLKWHLY